MIHERQDFPVEVQVKEWIVQHFFPGLFDSNPHRIAEGTVRPGIPRMAPLKAGFELGVMGGVGVCPTHLCHPACTWNPLCAHPRWPCLFPSLLTPCSCTQCSHFDQSDQLSHPPFSGRLSCFFVPWASQSPVSVLFPRTIHSPQKTWVITTVTLRMPGEAYEERLTFSS